MTSKNPFAINFGMIPNQYIQRELIVDEILGSFESDPMQNPCYMLTGIRGSGKTVTMTEIENQLSGNDDWIVIGLNPQANLLEDLVAKLYDSKSFISKFIAGSINLSKFGIGISLEGKAPVASIESALETILKEIKKQGKRLLVTIDEVSNTESMRQFASSYQIMIRQSLPFFLIMAGLYENIHNLEDEKTLTFLYRAPKVEMEPLNTTLISQRYMKVFDIDSDEAYKMAAITRGYPFAYQVLGKYVWESESKKLDDEVLIKFDIAMERYVYSKIWSELSDTDKWYLSFIATKDVMDTAELLSLTQKRKNEFSQYRARLRDKGIIDVSSYGKIAIKLPRFAEFVKMQEM